MHVFDACSELITLKTADIRIAVRSNTASFSNHKGSSFQKKEPFAASLVLDQSSKTK